MNETLPEGAGGERGKGQFQSRVTYAMTDRAPGCVWQTLFTRLPNALPYTLLAHFQLSAPAFLCPRPSLTTRSPCA